MVRDIIGRKGAGFCVSVVGFTNSSYWCDTTTGYNSANNAIIKPVSLFTSRLLAGSYWPTYPSFEGCHSGLHAPLNAPRWASCPSFGGVSIFIPLKQVKLFTSANFSKKRFAGGTGVWDYFQIQPLILIFEFSIAIELIYVISLYKISSSSWK